MLIDQKKTTNENGCLFGQSQVAHTSRIPQYKSHQYASYAHPSSVKANRKWSKSQYRTLLVQQFYCVLLFCQFFSSTASIDRALITQEPIELETSRFHRKNFV